MLLVLSFQEQFLGLWALEDISSFTVRLVKSSGLHFKNGRKISSEEGLGNKYLGQVRLPAS